MNIIEPQNLKEVLEIKRNNPEVVILDGGTDLLAQWSSGFQRPETVISIAGLTELNDICIKEKYLVIGAGVKHSSIENSELIIKHVPILSVAAATIGAPAIRNMGTVGGNIANGSPAADLPPALLVHDSIINLASKDNSRSIALKDFYKGYKELDLRPDEIIVSISVPVLDNKAVSRFRKIGSRKSQTISKVCLGALAVLEDGAIKKIRLAAGSVGPYPQRLYATEKLLESAELTEKLIEQSAKSAASEVSPIDDVRSTAEYRSYALGALVADFIRNLISGQ